ncbi:hypothetical protein SAMN05421780_101153 [Flexibacter flexilis DSM 6793]|uniref:DUF3575 domain-containing protein n=1 Tax=Flexibacter flexilis DSM 6793 TaxID=927664 RepID=A0A1I1DDT2_9BACT|nr:hypothetical protein [Flexibacter flexilis]SFB73139.1 hypothetical protein SAMN05421780_101153 [Flexibacter flexilis DSM 6793]
MKSNKKPAILLSTLLLASSSLWANNSGADSSATPSAPRRVAITATPFWNNINKSIFGIASVELFGKNYQKNALFTEKATVLSVIYRRGQTLDDLMQNKKAAAAYGVNIARKHFVNASPSRVFRPYLAYGLGLDYTKLNGSREKEIIIYSGFNHRTETVYYQVNQEMLRQQVFGHIGTELVFRNGFMLDTYFGWAYQNVAYLNNVAKSERINGRPQDVGYKGIVPTVNFKLGYMIGERARPKSDFAFDQEDETTQKTKHRKVAVMVSLPHLLTSQLRADIEIFSKKIRPEATFARQSFCISPRYYNDYQWFIGTIDNNKTYGYGLDLAHKLYFRNKENPNSQLYVGYGVGANYLNLEGKLTEFWGADENIHKQLIRYQGYTTAGVQLALGRNVVLDSYVGVGYKGTHQISQSNNTELTYENFTNPVYNGFYPVLGLKAGVQFGQ